jgi:phosphoglycerate dehydrogenase-like enzyme
MPKILYADNDYPDVDLERALFDPVGIEVVTAQCRTEEQVIAAAQDCCGILLQYAPIGARAVAALPHLGIVSRIGAGFDTVDTAACEAAGVWVANSPDYGVGEVATHALALALASIRNIVAYDRDVHAGRWHFMSPGTMRRPSELVLGIVGLGRIGKRMAHVSRNVFKRVVAYDPYLIDGDFPAYVERAPSLAALAGRADVVSLHTPLNAETRGMGSSGRTSSAAPASVPASSAPIKAGRSTTAPRAVLTRKAPRFSAAKKRASTMPRVSAVSGVCSETTSACPASAASVGARST